MGNKKSIRRKKSSGSTQPLEDRALKAAAQFMGKELLPLIGINGEIRRIAPTEQVYLNIKDFQQDFNYEMKDNTWIHLEFESDSITTEDLRRFRVYEAIASYYYKADVTTYVLCSSRVKVPKSQLIQKGNVYQVHVVRLKDENADILIQELEKKQVDDILSRQELVHLLLTPLMDGGMPQPERIKKGLQLIQNQQDFLEPDELLHMQSVLYTLAMKFLTRKELKNVKEALNMTTLGQMLMQDGFNKGLTEGMSKGLSKGQANGEERINQLNIRLADANRIDDITKAARDKKFQRKLLKEFHL